MIPYPNIDPILYHVGTIHIGGFTMPVDIRWYSLAYIAGIALGWWVLAREHARRPIPNLSTKALDDMVMWAVVGIVGGGRIGYMLFYKFDYYLHNPWKTLFLWEGGMSFHGGLIGVILAFWLFARKYNIQFLALIDVISCVVPIGLFFGRIANFINGELYGRPAGDEVPWAMVFPNGGDLPRHPSQLYEAGMEGLILFAVMMFLLKRTNARDRVGTLGGTFMVGYAIARMIGECFREPDIQLGFLFGFTTMGQLLCLPMLAIGLYLIARPRKLIAA